MTRRIYLPVMGGGGSGSTPQVQSDWNEANPLAVDYIKNKPLIPAQTQYYNGTISTALNDAIIADAPLAFWKCEESGAATLFADSTGNARPLTIVSPATSGGSGNTVLAHSRIIPTTANPVAMHWAATGSSRADYCGLVAPITGDVSFECVMTLAPFASAALTNFGNIDWFSMQGPNDEIETSNIQFKVQFANGRIEYLHEYNAGLNPYFDTQIPFQISPAAFSGPKHLVVTRTGATKTVRLYLNGLLMDTQTYQHDPTGGTNTPKTFLGGGIAGSANGIIAGYAAVYNKVLSVARIQAHSTAAGF